MPKIILSAAEPPLRNVEKLFSIPALRDIGDQIEYLPPTDFGNGTTQFSEKPIETAFFEFAVITIEFLKLLQRSRGLVRAHCI